MASTSFAASACCPRSLAVSRFIFSSNGSPSSSCSSAPTYRPGDENHYRLRFYFDSNSVPMADTDAHYIVRGYTYGGGSYFQVPFRFAAGDYQVRVEVVNDLSSWSSTPWVTLTDGPHALELEWKAATASGANNGILKLWVDDVLKGSFTTLDNDTHRIQPIDLGPYTGIDTGTRGTAYFDLFESRRDTYIGLDPAAPTPPPLPTPTETIFADGSESGNLSAWSHNANDGGGLSVTTGSALAGTYGMAALLEPAGTRAPDNVAPADAHSGRAKHIQSIGDGIKRSTLEARPYHHRLPLRLEP